MRLLLLLLLATLAGTVGFIVDATDAAAAGLGVEVLAVVGENNSSSCRFADKNGS